MDIAYLLEKEFCDMQSGWEGCEDVGGWFSREMDYSCEYITVKYITGLVCSLHA